MKLKQYITDSIIISPQKPPMDDKTKKKVTNALSNFMKSAKDILESVPLEKKERNIIREGLRISIQKLKDIQRNS